MCTVVIYACSCVYRYIYAFSYTIDLIRLLAQYIYSTCITKVMRGDVSVPLIFGYDGHTV